MNVGNVKFGIPFNLALALGSKSGSIEIGPAPANSSAQLDSSLEPCRSRSRKSHAAWAFFRLCPPNRKGLTLLEMLFVCSILVISVSAALSLSIQALHTSARSQRIVKGTVLAQNELEYWSTRPSAELALLTEGERVFSNPAAHAPENEADATTLTVRNAEPGILELTAAVQMHGSPNHPNVVKLTTWIADGDAQ